MRRGQLALRRDETLLVLGLGDAGLSAGDRGVVLCLGELLPRLGSAAGLLVASLTWAAATLLLADAIDWALLAPVRASTRFF